MLVPPYGLLVDLAEVPEFPGVMRAYGCVLTETQADRGTVCDWLTRHRLDPRDVPRGSVVIRDQIHHRITYERFVRHDTGEIRVMDDDPVTRIVVDQHEAGPMPFPDLLPFTPLGAVHRTTAMEPYPLSASVLSFHQLAQVMDDLGIKMDMAGWRPYESLRR